MLLFINLEINPHVRQEDLIHQSSLETEVISVDQQIKEFPLEVREQHLR